MQSDASQIELDEGLGSPSKIRRGQLVSACLVASNDETNNGFSAAFAALSRRLQRQKRPSSAFFKTHLVLRTLLLPVLFLASRQQLRSLQLFEVSTLLAPPTQERQISLIQRANSSVSMQNAASIATDAVHTEKNNVHGAFETARSFAVSDLGAQTLALLYPPGLLGGYRNQAMRFISFVTYAKRHNMTQLLLNSLMWSTQLDGVGPSARWFPIPFQWIFDVDYWNSFAPEHLPLLITDDQLNLGKATEGLCWTKAVEIDGYESLQVERRLTENENHNGTGHAMFVHEFAGQKSKINHLQRAALLQGALTPLLCNVTVPFITGQLKVHPRKQDFLPATEHCRVPYVYGGGSGAGRLWNAFLGFHSGVKTTGPHHRNTSSVPFETDVWVDRALRPAPQWRDLAERCVKQHAPTERYMALHARVELEMMGHVCGNKMEKNLTVILERVYELHKNLTKSEDSTREHRSGLLIAVSRAGMEEKSLKSYKAFSHFADENLQTLNIVTGRNASEAVSVKADGTPQLFQDLQQNLPVFECGERFVENFYATHPHVPNHGSLLNSVLNFYVAVNADVFVGVKHSSYSTDVLTTRFWLGKGDANYRYTQKGIERIDGLPEPHTNCKI